MNHNLRQTILIVDDVPGNIKFMMAMLVNQYEVMAANSGQNALKIVAARRPDLILLDVMMPDMDGYQVCQQLQANAATCHIPVIFVTAMDHEDDESRGFACGAVDYITKPVKPSVLHARVSTHLEIKRKREEIAERDAYMQSILDHAMDGMIAINSQGHIVEFNAAAGQLLGYERADFIGQPVDRFIVSSEWPAVLESLSTISSLHRRLFCVGHCADGHVVEIEMGLTTARWQQRLQLIAFLRDVTGERQLLRSLEETLKVAESASKTKSAFLANMSHEIRSPMNAIIGMTDLILTGSLSHEEEHNNLQIVLNAALSLLDLINDILDISKIEAGHFTLEHIPFDLWGRVEDVCETMAIKAHQKALDIFCAIDWDLPETLVGDPLRFKQILINLINNAMKFTSAGFVSVRVERADGVVKDDNSVMLHVSVVDSGIGIPADKLDMIFENFSQADDSTSRRYGGTGLGLGICKYLVHRMGGDLWVESVVDQGSTFHFTVRFDCEQGRSVAADDPLAGVRLLIGSGLVMGQQILDEMVTRFGAHAETVMDQNQLLARLAEAETAGQPFDLLLLDETMLREEWPFVQPMATRLGYRHPVIVLLPTNMSLNALKHHSWLDGALSLKKPVRRFRLLKRIQQALGRLPISGEAQQHNPVIRRRTDILSMNILLVEDLPANQKLAVTILQQAGHGVTIANHGGEALALMEQQPFDLVLMDLQMPTMNGFEATERIRHHEATEVFNPAIAIVAVTANALVTEKQKCETVGMNGYLSKPYRPHELIQVIEPFTKPRPNRNKGIILEPVDVDNETLDRLKAVFVAESGRMLTSLQEALSRQNSTQALQLVDQLRLISSEIGAGRIATQSIRFKGSVEMADWQEASEVLAVLTRHVEQILSLLA
ncbi:MAG: response regulator [Magnetococcales bacterium]|nr:response regulator [Magnetococcales bacterium]